MLCINSLQTCEMPNPATALFKQAAEGYLKCKITKHREKKKYLQYNAKQKKKKRG